MTDIKGGRKASAVKQLLLLHGAFLFFSFNTVFAKYASMYEFLSLNYILFSGAMFAILFIYSILWQLILRVFPLSMAFANRGVLTIWGFIWGMLFFDESISIAKAIAAVLIITGIVVIGIENE